MPRSARVGRRASPAAPREPPKPPMRALCESSKTPVRAFWKSTTRRPNPTRAFAEPAPTSLPEVSTSASATPATAARPAAEKSRAIARSGGPNGVPLVRVDAASATLAGTCTPRARVASKRRLELGTPESSLSSASAIHVQPSSARSQPVAPVTSPEPPATSPERPATRERKSSARVARKSPSSAFRNRLPPLISGTLSTRPTGSGTPPSRPIADIHGAQGARAPGSEPVPTCAAGDCPVPSPESPPANCRGHGEPVRLSTNAVTTSATVAGAPPRSPEPSSSKGRTPIALCPAISNRTLGLAICARSVRATTSPFGR